MKKYIVCLMIGLLFIGTTGCSKKVSNPMPEQTQIQSTMPEDMTYMTEPIDSLVRCMLENNKAYNPTDPEFFWSGLYYFLGEYGSEHPLVSQTEDARLKVPRKVAQEYAIALFANYEDLLPLPETLSESITYDEGWDSYLFELGDRGQTETVLSDYIESEDLYTVTAKVLAECTVTMQKNVFADGIAEPKYLYSVTGVTPVSGMDLPPQSVTALYNGLSDNHTVEATLEDGTIQAFQFYDSTISAKLHSLKEGDSFSFVYSPDGKTGALMILEVD